MLGTRRQARDSVPDVHTVGHDPLVNKAVSSVSILVHVEDLDKELGRGRINVLFGYRRMFQRPNP